MKRYALLLALLFAAMSGCKTTESSLQVETNLAAPSLHSPSPACDVTARFSITSHS